MGKVGAQRERGGRGRGREKERVRGAVAKDIIPLKAVLNVVG